MLDKQDLNELIGNIKKNEVIARKLFEIETSILSIHNFPELFENLLKLIEDKFSIPHVWLSLTTDSEVARLIYDAGTSDYVQARLNLVDPEAFDTITRGATTPILANDSMFYYHQLLPENSNWQLGSIAIAPLVYSGQVVGSLNQGDSSTSRFTPDLDTFFLTQMATKVSIALANVSAREQLHILATRDPLTHLFNRRELSNMLEKEFARSRREGLPVSLVFIDCDDFKQVNDTCGHDCGDAYLRHVAKKMEECIRQGDSAFRYAGDEFVILLPGQAGPEARLVGDRLRQALGQGDFSYRGQQVETRISFGVACSTEEGIEGAENLLKHADQDLYRDKAMKASRNNSNNNSVVR